MNRASTCHWFLAISALGVAGMACQTVMGLVNPPGRPVADTLFFDDFSDTSSGWDRREYEGGLTDYLDGQYQIRVADSNSDYWANPGLDFSDVRVETLATKVRGPDDNDFGVICRHQDIANFYYFVISSNGYAGILKVRDRQTIPLGSGRLEPADAIHQGNSTNRIAAECIGGKLRLMVNDQLVAEVQDSDLVSGDVGLIAGTFDTGGTDIRFDDFRVLEP